MAVTPETARNVIKRAGGRCEGECGRWFKNIRYHYPAKMAIHHWLYHRAKGKPERDVEENLAYVCFECHPKSNSFESRQWFWARQVQHYGRDRMVQFNESIPEQVREYFE